MEGAEDWAAITTAYRDSQGALGRLGYAVAVKNPTQIMRAVDELRQQLQIIGVTAWLIENDGKAAAEE